MLRIIVTGKPSKFTSVTPKGKSKVTAIFYLEEKRWVQGEWKFITWTCCVPAYKETWARAATEKGYTVCVEADDMFVSPKDGDAAGIYEFMLMVTNVTGL